MSTFTDDEFLLLSWIREQNRGLTVAEIREYAKMQGFRFGSGAGLLKVLIGYNSAGRVSVNVKTGAITAR
jgi:hypothetical protein